METEHTPPTAEQAKIALERLRELARISSRSFADDREVDDACKVLEGLLRPDTPSAAGRYRFLCTKGHHSVSSKPTYPTCEAVLPWPETAESEPCGAQATPYDDEWLEDAGGLAVGSEPDKIVSSSEGWKVTGYDDGTLSVECCVPTLDHDAALALAARINEWASAPKGE